MVKLRKKKHYQHIYLIAIRAFFKTAYLPLKVAHAAKVVFCLLLNENLAGELYVTKMAFIIYINLLA